MNIVCDGSTLKPAKMNTLQAYSLDELVFYIVKELQPYKLYLIINSGNKADAVELKQVNSTNKSYYNYQCAMNHPVKIHSGQCKISLFGFRSDNLDDHFTTTSLTLQFDNTNYNFKAQIRVIEEFSQASAAIYRKMEDLYNKVVDLTKLNIEMLHEESQGEST